MLLPDKNKNYGGVLAFSWTSLGQKSYRSFPPCFLQQDFNPPPLPEQKWLETSL
jgi:hypothetical protein